MSNTRSAILLRGRDAPSDETMQTVEQHADAVEATRIVGDPDPETAVPDAPAILSDADEVVAEAEPDLRRGYDRATAERFEGKYLSLTSFKRDGTAVATPVWFVADDGHLLVETDADSYKVKRIRRSPHVRIALCNARGQLRGEAFDAEVTILPDSERARVERLLAQKYRIDRLIVYPLYRLITRLRGRGSRTHEPPVTLAITPYGAVDTARPQGSPTTRGVGCEN